MSVNNKLPDLIVQFRDLPLANQILRPKPGLSRLILQIDWINTDFAQLSKAVFSLPTQNRLTGVSLLCFGFFKTVPKPSHWITKQVFLKPPNSGRKTFRIKVDPRKASS
jgi:hypothetical protein